MNRLWLLLLAFLALGVEPGQNDDPPDELEAGDTGDETLDDLLDGIETSAGSEAAPEGEDTGKALKEAQRRAAQAENERDSERAARTAAEARAAPLPRQSDPDFEREEAELAAAKAAGSTPEQLSWLQWKIDSNRGIRATRRESSQALFEARDIADKTTFDQLAITKPQTYKRYADRVEKVLAETRAKGERLPPRAMVLRVLIGDDIMNGKVQPKKRAAGESTVDRGRSPAGRSDVRSKGATSDREKRRARLENQII